MKQVLSVCSANTRSTTHELCPTKVPVRESAMPVRRANPIYPHGNRFKIRVTLGKTGAFLGRTRSHFPECLNDGVDLLEGVVVVSRESDGRPRAVAAAGHICIVVLSEILFQFLP